MQGAFNHHIQYPGMSNQHWHAGSGTYAGGDHLLTALSSGWEITRCVQINHLYAGNRGVIIYEFTLTSGGETMVMPVITNPYIERMLATTDLPVEQADGSDTAEAADQRARQDGAA